MSGDDFLSKYITPSRSGLEKLRVHASRLGNPALRLFLLSVLDQEAEGLNDMEELCNSDSFPVLNSDLSTRVMSYIRDLDRQEPPQSEDIQLLRQIYSYYVKTAQLYDTLAAGSENSSLKDSFLNQAAEERKRARLLEDRISLEELTH